MSKDQTSYKKKPLETIKLYKYMPWEIAEKVLTNWDMKLTLPHQANDPFEWMPAKGVEYPWSDQSEKLCDLGFLCFSSKLESPALWGHYADSHRGVCLEFTFPVRHPKQSSILVYPEKLFLLINKVRYSTKRFHEKHESPASDDPAEDELNIAARLDSFDKLLTTKDPSWRSESEYRIIHPIRRATRVQDGMIFTNLPMEYLSGIYLGIRCPHNIAYVASWLYHVIKRKKSSLFYEDEIAEVECLEDVKTPISQDEVNNLSEKPIWFDSIDIVQMQCNDLLFRVNPDRDHVCSIRIKVRESTLVQKEVPSKFVTCYKRGLS